MVEVIKILAPAFANNFAEAKPIPSGLPTPVTRATFPFKLNKISSKINYEQYNILVLLRIFRKN